MQKVLKLHFDKKYELRILVEDGKPWFAVRDVRRVLDQHRPMTRWLRSLPAGHVRKIYISDTNRKLFTAGERALVVFNLDALRGLLTREAEVAHAPVFERWVDTVVLPAIGTETATTAPKTPTQAQKEHTMTNIANININITPHDTLEHAVDARELHQALGVKTRFNDWVQRAVLTIEGLVAGEDFHSFLRKTQGRPRQDYLLTLDTAKHIALMSGTAMGHMVRKYFIAAEKELHRAVEAGHAPSAEFRADMETLKSVAEKYMKTAQALYEANEEMKPKAAFVDSYVDGRGTYSLTEVAKLLGIKPRAFVARLHGDNYLYRNVKGENLAYQHHLDKGFFTQRTQVRPGGHIMYTHTRVTPRGVDILAKRYGCIAA